MQFLKKACLGHVEFAGKCLGAVVGNHLIPACYDFEAIIKPLNNPHGKITSNHYFELSRDAEGHVICRIARFLRSEKFIINKAESDDPTAFRIFKEMPDLTKFPAVIEKPKLDEEKHRKICDAVFGTIPPDAQREMQEFPKIYNNYPPPEAFETLLQRIKSKVVTPAATPVPLPDDPDNERLNQFLNSEKIKKFWSHVIPSEPSTSEIEPTTNVTLPAPPLRKRTTTTVTEETPAAKIANTTPNSSAEPSTSTAPPKRRGRPRKEK